MYMYKCFQANHYPYSTYTTWICYKSRFIDKKMDKNDRPRSNVTVTRWPITVCFFFLFWQVCLLWRLVWMASLGPPLQRALCWWPLLLCPPYCATSRFINDSDRRNKSYFQIGWSKIEEYVLRLLVTCFSIHFLPVDSVLVTSEIRKLLCPILCGFLSILLLILVWTCILISS